ncbi:hypothetical protein [Streptomyces alboflavus]|uniref:hypothetical protein n=1 Tax=Streptomyces alboflavus TaxID=67267 RepID=UPI0004C09681|nr:hypothetical protein [Streptomyces alboflavus]
MMSKIRTSLVGAAALGTAVFALPAVGAQAQPAAPATERTAVSSAGDVGAQAPTCWKKTIKIDGGKLKYKECAWNGKRSVTGTLNDTKGNGRCVHGKIVFVPSGVTDKYTDCGGKVTKISTGWWKAADAKVYLSG